MTRAVGDVDFKCEQCGTINQCLKSQTNTRRFCNQKCSLAYRKAHPEQYVRTGMILKKPKDPNRDFTCVTLTLVADDELRSRSVLTTANACGWDLPRFMQQMEVNRESIDKRKRFILDRQKQSAKQWGKRYSGSYSDKFSSAHTGQRIDKI